MVLPVRLRPTEKRIDFFARERFNGDGGRPMKLVSLLTLGGAFLLLELSVFGQGSLTPPAAPTPTMKTLDQVKAGTPIGSAPYTISSSGNYFLTGDLSVGSGNTAITINSSGVTLDLNGFTITSTSSPAAGTAILINGAFTDVTILNGHIVSSVTYSGGTYSGNGFQNGISSPSSPLNVRVSGVTVSGVSNQGIYLANTTSSVVDSCIVHVAGASGIYAATVNNSTADVCGAFAIYGGATTSNCYGSSNGSGGIWTPNANNCYGYTTANSANGLTATNAINCYGVSNANSSTGSGLFCFSGSNCYGFNFSNSASSYGINAFSVSNCYGFATGIGINAYNAENCSGASNDSYGLYAAYSATGCYGSSSGSIGLFARIATNCYGTTTASSDGLNAFSATNCFGNCSNTGTGIGLFATNANNCYGITSGTSYGLFASTSAIACVGQSNSGTGLFANIVYACYGIGSPNLSGHQYFCGSGANPYP